ncbi:iron-sulfur cluster assembly accessory protein [filamentous cyanobacterium LEGE 11480]|uniref:Iron-sulfur cluster assembly accessory protein n=1 Tax=Romeriopsis navalis LEGE 11480 TaxID=2777977 RepID=A0A928Z3J9_9CYAN|nr:iron-sulfur cluster assembly accessory protein [Romeriopsis navalis]MBE9029375.1 iron-sulfur cluster assembly accessory protein [Romeriopsis navalis LEGE 11480]
MIQFSDSAIAEIQRIQTKQSSNNSHFRLAVIQDGCAGLAYDLKFDPQIQADDQHFTIQDLSIVVDANSAAQIQGIAIDYTEDLMGGGFQFSNPQAQRSCSCGMSFSMSTDNTDEWQVDCGL